MIEELKMWPRKLQDGCDLAHNFHYEYAGQLPQQVKKIAFIGMGGSGIAGRIVKTFLDTHATELSVVIDSPHIPTSLDAETLAVVISYSGNTWETVACFQELIKQHVPTIVLAHGGTIAELAEKHNIPFVLLPDSKTPRSSLGATLGFLLILFDLLHLFEGKKILKAIQEHVRTYLPKFEADSTLVDEFIQHVGPREMFHIMGVSGDSAACAYRAQTQFNENSKMHVVASNLPESAHNLLVGFTHCKDKPLVLMISTDFLSPELEVSCEIIGDLLAEHGADVYKLPVLGDTWESQLFHIVLWADFASYHLGKKRGVNVEPVEIIDELKARFAKRKFT